MSSVFLALQQVSNKSFISSSTCIAQIQVLLIVVGGVEVRKLY